MTGILASGVRILRMQADLIMTRRSQTVFVAMAGVGAVAGLAAGWLIWLMLTEPVAVALALAGGF